MAKQNWFKDVKAVGFDLDGTLYKSTPEFNNWVRENLLELVVCKVGGSARQIENEFQKRREEFGSTTMTLNSYGLDGEQIFQDLFDKAPLEKFILPDGKLAKLLNDLSKKYKLFIISNGTERQVLRKLKYLEIGTELFSPLVSCYDHDGWVKPNPGSFLYVLDELDLAPNEVLFVGDREATDIEGARGVEMRTAMVWGESELADISLETVYDLGKLLL